MFKNNKFAMAPEANSDAAASTAEKAVETKEEVKATDASASVGAPAEAPAKTTTSPLSHLTALSARFIVCEVAVFNPSSQKRNYLYGNQSRTAYHFQCMLVSTEDPTQYMLGDAHGKGMNEAKLNALTNRFKAGLVFRMSKINFADNTNQQYNSTPKTEVVSMVNTTFNPVLVSAAKPIMAEPAIPIVASLGIDHEQLFDAMALVQSVSPTSPGGRTSKGQARVRCQVLLNDGSVSEDTRNVCHMPVTIFADATTNGADPPVFQELRKAATDHTAMAFFGIQGKKATSEDDGGTWSFTSSFGFMCKNASNTTKGKALEEEAARVMAAQGEEIPQATLQNRSFEDNESFADTEATETTCAFLRSIMSTTKVSAIESENTFWQINFCFVHLPDKTAEISTKDNSRLWFSVKVEDETGQLNIFMREKAALALSGTDSKDEFDSFRANYDLDFPPRASIKIIRKPAGPQTPESKDTAQQAPLVSCYIVEAAAQAMRDTPSKSSLALINLLEQTEARADARAAASLVMIKKDFHYGLSVSYMVENKVVKKRCTRAVALVRAMKDSKAVNMNEGFQMITEGVRDPLDEDFSCTLMSFCSVRTSADYQLKPMRGEKSQMAFVVISDVLQTGSADKPTVFLVESLEKIPDSEARVAPEQMRYRIQFASLIAKMQGKSKVREWTDTASPASGLKCRKLGRSPTDEPLEPYKSRCGAV